MAGGRGAAGPRPARKRPPAVPWAALNVAWRSARLRRSSRNECGRGPASAGGTATVARPMAAADRAAAQTAEGLRDKAYLQEPAPGITHRRSRLRTALSGCGPIAQISSERGTWVACAATSECRGAFGPRSAPPYASEPVACATFAPLLGETEPLRDRTPHRRTARHGGRAGRRGLPRPVARSAGPRGP